MNILPGTKPHFTAHQERQFADALNNTADKICKTFSTSLETNQIICDGNFEPAFNASLRGLAAAVIGVAIGTPNHNDTMDLIMDMLSHAQTQMKAGGFDQGRVQ